MPLILAESEVRILVPIADLVDVMERALASFSSGQVNQPVRASVHMDAHRAFFGVMPAYLAAPPALGAKLVTVFGGNTSQHGIQARISGAKFRQVLEHCLSSHLAHLVARALPVKSGELGHQFTADLSR
ncbi:MAG: hypothetical protein LAP39_26750 [Acidobacteriia bacterium]|nr:hypothetical protein [Terriglobia bacterium]